MGGTKEKKRSKKASSHGRKKKMSRNGSKRSAKKLRRREDSYSDSGDESMSLVASSTYSSEEDVGKGKRSRSRVRKDVKERKKRVRSSSCSSGSSSDSVRVKKRKSLKRKSSKKKVGLGRKKKDGKKRRRVASLSSTSSDESDNGELKKKEKRRRYDKEEKSRTKKKITRARSISPSSENSESDNDRKRKRKRYQSASPSPSTASSESEREGKRKRYWSPSSSSLSGGSKNSDQRIQVLQDEIEVQNKPIRKLNSIIVVSSSADQDQNATSERLDNGLDTMDDERIPKQNVVEKGINIKVNEIESPTEAMATVPENEDLETVLRRKALENLKRFRGGPKTLEKIEKSATGVNQLPNSENVSDQGNTGGSDMKHALSSKISSVQNESHKDQVINVNLDTSSEKEETLASPSVSNKSMSFKNNVEPKSDVTESAQCSEDKRVMIPKAGNLNHPPAIADKDSKSGDGGVSRQNLIPRPVNSSNVKSKPGLSRLSTEPLAACSNKGLKSSPQECINATPAPSNSSTDKSGNSQIEKVNPKIIGNIIKESNTVNATVPENNSLALPDAMAGEHISSEHQKENKEDSQFQEKTMTVMRGGELVQVNYKVYIPKKAPAANRRRLNR